MIAPDIRVVAQQMALDRCLERRRDVEACAARVSNPRAKAGILRTAPICGPSLATK